MPRYHFDCLLDGVLHPDAFGVEMLDEDVADQAQAVMMNIIGEVLPNKTSMMVTVTVRAQHGEPVYMGHGSISGFYLKQAPAPSLEEIGKD